MIENSILWVDFIFLCPCSLQYCERKYWGLRDHIFGFINFVGGKMLC